MKTRFSSKGNLKVLGVGFLIVVLTLVTVHTAYADGGLIVPDPKLWALIQEGQQIAVIQINQDNTAQVDLFITMVDRSGKSHEVVFFIPLGFQASDFNVIEQTSLEFDKALTEQLDQRLREYGQREATYSSTVQSSLALGTVMTNGLWSSFILLPAFLSSCAPMAIAPIAKFETESSFISIYDMDEETDVEGLIATTGLDPSVKETLEDLAGQQIAVVNLQTQPESPKDEWGVVDEIKGQPGIHLRWTSALVEHSAEAAYTYPLGTGRAWASPIELTRIYVIAPKGIDFSVQSPELGSDLSGLEGDSWAGLSGRIYWKIDEAKSPAFAKDNSYGSYGRIWRGTFVKSNSDRDIVITKLASVSAETGSAIRTSQFHQVVSDVTWIISLLVGILFWILSWWFIMTRISKLPYRWREGKLYADAFTWSIIYPGVTILALVIAGLVGFGIIMLLFASPQPPEFLDRLFQSETSQLTLLFMIGLPIWIAVIGLVNAYLFSRLKASKLDISRIRAFFSYLLVILLANILYFGFAAGYAVLVGAL